MQDGTILVNATGALALSGDFTMNDGTLSLVMDSDSSQVTVADLVYIEGGDLVLDFSDNPVTSAADITLITAGAVYGQFNSVIAAGYTVTLSYQRDRISAHVVPK